MPSVIEYSPEATVYVVDNASSDDSVVFMKAHFPMVQLIQNTRNFGFAEGYNEGLRHVDAEIFALVNSDIEVTPNWLKPLLETFEKEPEVGIIQPKIRHYKNKDYFEYAGAAGGFIDQYGYPFCRGRIFETIEKDTKQYDDDCNIFWASGACFFIRSSVYHSLNGFDADFFAHQEEIDLCWRAINKGHQIKYSSKSIVYHLGGATLQKANPQKTFLNFRNSLLMLVKNLPKSSLFKVLFIRLLLDSLAGIQFLLKGQPFHTMAIINAHFHFYHLISRSYKKRGQFQSSNYYKTKSIVYLYFIKKLTTFKEIF